MEHKSILIVDGDAQISHLWSTYFTKLNHTCVHVPTTQCASQYIAKSGKPDLLIVDLQMYEAEIFRGITQVIGLMDEAAAPEADLFQNIIAKPIGPRELYHRVESLFNEG